MLVVELGGSTMLARIGIMRALSAGRAMVDQSRRKTAEDHRVENGRGCSTVGTGSNFGLSSGEPAPDLGGSIVTP